MNNPLKYTDPSGYIHSHYWQKGGGDENGIPGGGGSFGGNGGIGRNGGSNPGSYSYDYSTGKYIDYWGNEVTYSEVYNNYIYPNSPPDHLYTHVSNYGFNTDKMMDGFKLNGRMYEFSNPVPYNKYLSAANSGGGIPGSVSPGAVIMDIHADFTRKGMSTAGIESTLKEGIVIGATGLAFELGGAALGYLRYSQQALKFFDGVNYSSKVMRQMSNAKDLYHAFPAGVDGFAAKFGQYSLEIGSDGAAYQWLRLEGTLGGEAGVFEYIKDANGIIAVPLKPNNVL